MAQKLVCHNNDFSWIASGGNRLTLGKEYEIVRETKDDFFIVDDDGHECCFTKMPDYNELSYLTWFALKED